MLENPNLLDWDSITALPLAQANQLLLERHLLRLSQGHEIDSLGGVIEMDMSDLAYHLAGYRLSAPALAIAQPSYVSARVDMHGALQGGTLVQVEKPYKVRSLSLHDPLNSLALTQQLYPAGEQGELLMDLAEGEDVRLALGSTPAEQAQAGRWLHGELQRIKQQAPEKLLQVLAHSETEIPALALGTVELRTQVDVDGKSPALLIFASSKLGSGGGFPANDDAFPHLLVPDLQSGEGTQLLALRLLHRISLLKGFKGLLEKGEFTLEQDDSGLLIRAVATAGQLRVGSTRYQSRDYEFESKVFDIPVSGLEAAFLADGGEMCWQTQCTVDFTCLSKETGLSLPLKATFALDLRYHYYLTQSADPGQSMLEGQFFAPWPEVQEAEALSGLPGDIDEEMKAQCEDFVAYAAKRAILLGMAKQLDAASPEQWLGAQRLAEHAQLSPRRWEMPSALAVFGAQGTGATFGIGPAEVMMLAGTEHTFALTNPPEQPVQWSLETLPSSPSNPGTLDNGVYRAPPKYTLQGRSGQVLVVARDSQGAQAVAVVTVLRHPLTVNPFISTIQANGEQVLSAATLGEFAVQWQIAAPVAGESGELVVEAEGRQCRYRAGPSVANKTYVLDEIKVQKVGSDDVQRLYVLVVQQQPGLVVALEGEPANDGALQFIAYLNGNPMAAQWRLAVGPGQIDAASGLYTPGIADEAPGILVFASVDGGSFGTFEGHLIIPLDLLRFPALGRQLQAAPADHALPSKR
jgi:hypothetical protein